jgi:hypothetical protein
LGADVFCDLGCSNAAAARRMDEDRLVRLETAHDHDKLPSGEIIDWDRGCFQRRHARRACENLFDRDAYPRELVVSSLRGCEQSSRSTQQE